MISPKTLDSKVGRARLCILGKTTKRGANGNHQKVSMGLLRDLSYWNLLISMQHKSTRGRGTILLQSNLWHHQIQNDSVLILLIQVMMIFLVLCFTLTLDSMNVVDKLLSMTNKKVFGDRASTYLCHKFHSSLDKHRSPLLFKSTEMDLTFFWMVSTVVDWSIGHHYHRKMVHLYCNFPVQMTMEARKAGLCTKYGGDIKIPWQEICRMSRESMHSVVSIQKKYSSVVYHGFQHKRRSTIDVPNSNELSENMVEIKVSLQQFRQTLPLRSWKSKQSAVQIWL
mmetsp:Transcript_23386/g.32671  ORF Transcript_23386/g.32671 Transcript_23386/m.32671 type:complete len:282 (-) Transcript_23386:282-1127(-)